MSAIAFDVYLDGLQLNTVFHSPPVRVEDVRASLVGHDGYDPDIVVVRADAPRWKDADGGLIPRHEPCAYCGGMCPQQEGDSEFICDGFSGDIEGFYTPCQCAACAAHRLGL